MQIWITIALVIQMISALVMIGLVLMQHGKGADMGASFGSGASGSLFGATGSANFLSRTTAVCAAVFFACTLLLALFSHGRGANAAGDRGSVLDRPAAAASAPASAASGASPAASAQPSLPAASQGAPAIPNN